MLLAQESSIKWRVFLFLTLLGLSLPAFFVWQYMTLSLELARLKSTPTWQEIEQLQQTNSLLMMALVAAIVIAIAFAVALVILTFKYANLHGQFVATQISCDRAVQYIAAWQHAYHQLLSHARIERISSPR